MQNKIIDILIHSEGYVSGQDISAALGVSRQAVWKAVNSLKEKGYIIESVTNKGYRLISAPDYLNEHSIRTHLKTAIIGRQLVVLDSVGSTNDYLKEEGNRGCENGLVAVAREQTKGKGRLGRAWQTKKDDGVEFSFLIRPNIAPNEAGVITPLAGLAVCKAIREYTGLDCKIKWPNDIIVNNKKLVGILSEMIAEFDAVNYVVTGIGINTEHSEFPQEIAHKATSIFLETGKHTDKNKFLAHTLKRIEEILIKSNLELNAGMLSDYTSLCATIGRSVSFTRNNISVIGTAVGIESNGELKVRADNDEIHIINSGEVTAQGIY